MQVLSIGNSFSADAQRYLHRIALADGVELKTCNLYIGGCSLETHHRNMLSEERAYELQANGFPTGFKVSIKEALLNRKWDVITLQQASLISRFLILLSNTSAPVSRKQKLLFIALGRMSKAIRGSTRILATATIRKCSVIFWKRPSRRLRIFRRI